MVWHLDVGFSNIKKYNSSKWECSSHTLGTWAEISLVYIFNTTIVYLKNLCSVRKDQQQIAIADISYLVVSQQR